MPSHTESRTLPYSVAQLFALVMDIEKYPEFLPWCIDARITKSQKNYLEAEVVIGYKIFREKFSCRVHFMRPKKIEIEYMQGPMQHLMNIWSFKPQKAGCCVVGFHVDFSMKSRLLGAIVEQFFHVVFLKMVKAFEERANQIYRFS